MSKEDGDSLQKKNLGTCALCGGHTSLKKSHIVSDFLYKGVFDDGHKSLVLPAAPNARPRKAQTGLWQRLLCSCCEGRLEKHETYISNVIAQQVKVTVKPIVVEPTGVPECRGVCRISGLDYSHCKLFCLSVIWRASVANLPELECVDLGPHEPHIRKLILDGQGGNWNQYPVTVHHLTSRGSIPLDFVFPPWPDEHMGSTVYRFYARRFVWSTMLTSDPLPQGKRECFLQEDGSLHLVKMDIEDVAFIRGHLTEAKRNGVFDRIVDSKGRADQ